MPSTERKYKRLRSRATGAYAPSACLLLCLLGIILIPVIITNTQHRSSVPGLEPNITITQSFVQPNNAEIINSVVIINNDPTNNINITSVFNSLINGSMTCIPPFPTVIPPLGMLMCNDTYIIRSGDDVINSTISVNDMPGITNQFQVVIYPQDIIFTQSLTQINNNEIVSSLMLTNNDATSDIEIVSVFNSLIGLNMTCIPSLPTVVASGGGMLVCNDIYIIQPGDDVLNSTVIINDLFNVTEQIHVIVFPPEICNHTAVQYGENIGSISATSRFFAPSMSADGNTMGFLSRSVSVDPFLIFVQEFNGTDWIAKGANSPFMLPLEFDATSRTGVLGSTSLSDDGNTFATTFTSIPSGGPIVEFAVVYDLIGGTTWTQRGNVVRSTTSMTTDPGVGRYNFVSLSGDGNTFVFLVEPDFAEPITNVTATVYEWNGMNWGIRGSPVIVWEGSPNNVEPYSVSLSGDTNHFVVNVHYGNPNHTLFTHVYEWNSMTIDWQIKGQVLEHDSISLVFEPPFTTTISTNGNIIFAAGVYDFNGLEWIKRPDVPNLPPFSPLTPYSPSMTVDGMFVLTYDFATQIMTTSEWKPGQNEWAVCHNTSIPVFVPVGGNPPIGNVHFFHTTFSRDGMHFFSFESDTSFNPATGSGGLIRTFNFFN